MALQHSETVRNGFLDSLETTIGTAPTLEVYTGTKPANCAASATGTKIASITLPSDWLAAASGGSKAKSGTWEDSAADADGTAGYFRIVKSGTCHQQGTVTATGGGGDMTVDNTSFVTGQKFTVTGYTLTAPGA